MDQPVKMLLFFLMDGRWSDGAELGGCFFCCLHFDSVVSFQCLSRLTEVFHSGLVSYDYVNLSCALENGSLAPGLGCKCPQYMS